MNSAQRGLSLADGFDLSGMTLPELWLRYIGVGGSESANTIQEHVSGDVHLSSRQHNVLAQAINEYFIERQQNHPVAYQGIVDVAL